MALSSVSNILIITICTIGFGTQVFEVGDRYLKYQCKSLIHMEFPLSISMPSLSVCFRASEIYNRTLIEESKNIEYPKASPNWTSFYRILEKFSVKDIFDYTPKTDEVLSKGSSACFIRFPGKFKIFKYPFPRDDECYPWFNITKYLQREYMCYKFNVNHNSTDDGMSSIEQNNLGPNLPGLIYGIYFNKKVFGGVSFLTAFVHGKDTSTLFDSIFNPSIYHDVIRDENGTIEPATYADLMITYQGVRIHRLKAPHDTMCVDYHPFKSRLEKILTDVRRESMKVIKLVPTLGQLTERYDLPLLTSHHVGNDSIVDELSSIINKYQTDHPECDIQYYMSHIKSGRGRYVRVVLNWPQNINLSIEYQHEESVLDLIIYTSSCLGLWFGLSVIDVLINAKNFVLRKKTKQTTSSQHKKCDKKIKLLKQQLRINQEILIRKVEKMFNDNFQNVADSN